MARTATMRDGSIKTYLTCAETATLLRKALKAEFPAAKFSVRSRTYAGGASIDVRWTDGPLTSAVRRVCDRYEGATFDPMIDLKEYKTSLMTDEDGTVRTVNFGADWILTQRDVSAEFEASLVPEFERIYRMPYSPENLYPERDATSWNGHAIEGHEYDGKTLLHRLALRTAGALA